MTTQVAPERPKSSRSRSGDTQDSRIANWISETNRLTPSAPPPPTLSSKHKQSAWPQKRRIRLTSLSNPARRVHRASLKRHERQGALDASTQSSPTPDPADSGSRTPYPAIVLLISCFGISAILPSLLVLLAFAAFITFAPGLIDDGNRNICDVKPNPFSAELDETDGLEGTSTEGTRTESQKTKRKRL
ncbi:hypothetical protein FA15DRAFT_704515 [Coprinopsis marcescibilis]|uniref:Uncharacterized protein n=1 Tax=Coprinopsis marcescibilis TaxID=230819 RepID=A0A5C3KVT0_COPMA|nr:hypothetical protein FA15DRAFT_704515 [Coprinopsis marcescibilis]